MKRFAFLMMMLVGLTACLVSIPPGDLAAQGSGLYEAIPSEVNAVIQELSTKWSVSTVQLTQDYNQDNLEIYCQGDKYYRVSFFVKHKVYGMEEIELGAPVYLLLRTRPPTVNATRPTH